MIRLKTISTTLTLILSITFASAQRDSTKTYRTSRAITHSATASLYISSFLLLNKAWYKQYPKSSFHFFNDSKEWMQIDKFGHAQTAYFLTNSILYPTYKRLGYSKKQAIIGSASVAWIYQATIEVLDGYSTNWGASWSDLAANTLGIALAASQQMKWNEQRILFKYSTSKVQYKNSDTILTDRVNNLYGTTLLERLFKDYNGTTFWLSGNIKAITGSKNKIPSWLNIAIGYGAEGMLGGFENRWSKNKINYNYQHIDRYRQYYLSLDVDFTRIPIKGKLWSHVAPILNIFKIPSPTIQMDKNGFTGHWIHF